MTHQEPLRILIVEDNPGDVGLIRHALWGVPRLQFTLTHLERLAPLADRVAAESFDVLLLDLSLPDSFGLDTVARAVAMAPDLPIVVVSGADAHEVGIQSLTRGAQDYIVKGDADGWQLLRAIRYAVERKRTQLELQHAHTRYEVLWRQQAEAALGLEALLESVREPLTSLRQGLSDAPARLLGDQADASLARAIQAARGLAHPPSNP